jgi:hypothetical protein
MPTARHGSRAPTENTRGRPRQKCDAQTRLSSEENLLTAVQQKSAAYAEKEATKKILEEKLRSMLAGETQASLDLNRRDPSFRRYNEHMSEQNRRPRA